MSEIFIELIRLAEALGVSRINELPGCWEVEIDPRWRVAVNGGNAERLTTKGEKVPAFSAVVWRNGWPAGCIGPMDGVMAGGTEDELIAALQARTAQLDGREHKEFPR